MRNQQVVVILNVKQPSITNPIDHPDGSTVITAIVDGTAVALDATAAKGDEVSAL